MRRIERCLSLTALLLASLVQITQGQPSYQTTYRPPESTYRVFEYGPFTIIYELGLEQEAREAARILEENLPGTKELVGLRGRLFMPVVLNNFDDFANGYVTPLPFKQEIEGVAMKGLRISPRFENWLETVLPHELTHAVHADLRGGFGLGWIVRPFAPDVARTIQLSVPPGVSEGLAVYRESRLHEGAGRLNYPRFTMRFDAAMASDDPWSLAQSLEWPGFSEPIDRFYLGGSHFHAFLAEREGDDFFPKAQDFYQRLPFLGYGLALWVATGTPLHRLGREFRRASRARIEARTASLGPLTEPTVLVSEDGLMQRRPFWVDDSTLVVYANGYDVRPGFYEVDAATGRRRAVAHHYVTDDYGVSLEPGGSLLFTRYLTDAFSDVQDISEVFRLDPATGEAERLTRHGRMHGPVAAPGGGFWAFRNDGQFSDWVHVSPGGVVRELFPAYERIRYRAAYPSPDSSETAVLLNVRGHQGLFRYAPGAERLEPWLLFEEATIYEAAWSPDGRYLLFAAGVDRISNVFAYDLQEDALLKLTNVAFGALDPAVSPDGSRLAFIRYRGVREELVLIPFDPASAERLAPSLVAFGRDLPWEAWMRGEAEPASPELVGTRPYRPLEFLAPRMVYPLGYFDDTATGDGVDLGIGAGLGIQGADPLQRWAYMAEGFYMHGRLWGTAALRTAASVVRPAVSVFDLPSTVNARIVRRDETGAAIDTTVQRIGREQRGAGAGLHLPILLDSNVRRTSLLLGVVAEVKDERHFDEEGDALTAFRARASIRPGAVLSYRVQANRRDLVPNSGLVATVSGREDVWAENREIERQWLGGAGLYLPFLMRVNGGLHLHAQVLWQNRGGIGGLGYFLPRGYGDDYLDGGTFLRYGLDYVQPVWFVDDGFLLLPVYFEALYVYGFAERMDVLGGTAPAGGRTSFGTGVGLRLRLFSRLSGDFRIGTAYRVEEGDWRAVYR